MQSYLFDHEAEHDEMDGKGENVGFDLTGLVPVEEVVTVNPVVDQKKHEAARFDDWKQRCEDDGGTEDQRHP
jgi:hypothetical protein